MPDTFFFSSGRIDIEQNKRIALTEANQHLEKLRGAGFASLTPGTYVETVDIDGLAMPMRTVISEEGDLY